MAKRKEKTKKTKENKDKRIPKTKLQKANKTLSIIFCVLFVFTLLLIVFASPMVKVETASIEDFVDTPKLEFTAGTYGGKDFGSQEDVVNYYVECYNNTKTILADYEHNGESKKYYKLVGDESLSVENLLVEGKSNSTINSLVPAILGGLFKGNVKSLSPGNALDPEWDNQEVEGSENIDRRISHLTNEDVLCCSVEDLGEGKIKIQIQPKAQVLAMQGQDPQGRFFNVLGDISSTVNSISVLSFSEGTIEDNFVVNYAGGVGAVTIDVANNEIVEADYEMDVHIDVQHANVTILKDKSASLDVVYKNHFPASDEFINEHGLYRK